MYLREICEAFSYDSQSIVKFLSACPILTAEATGCRGCLSEIPLFILAEFYSFTLLTSRKSCPSRVSLWPHFGQKKKRWDSERRRRADE